MFTKCILLSLVCIGAAQARLIVLEQGYGERQDGLETHSYFVVDHKEPGSGEAPEAVARIDTFELQNDTPSNLWSSIFSPATTPLTWFLQQLEAVQAMQQAAFAEVLESQSAEAPYDQLRKVGNSRFKKAMRDYQVANKFITGQGDEEESYYDDQPEEESAERQEAARLMSLMDETYAFLSNDRDGDDLVSASISSTVGAGDQGALEDLDGFGGYEDDDTSQVVQDSSRYQENDDAVLSRVDDAGYAYDDAYDSRDDDMNTQGADSMLAVLTHVLTFMLGSLPTSAPSSVSTQPYVAQQEQADWYEVDIYDTYDEQPATLSDDSSSTRASSPEDEDWVLVDSDGSLNWALLTLILLAVATGFMLISFIYHWIQLRSVMRHQVLVPVVFEHEGRLTEVYVMLPAGAAPHGKQGLEVSWAVAGQVDSRAEVDEKKQAQEEFRRRQQAAAEQQLQQASGVVVAAEHVEQPKQV